MKKKPAQSTSKPRTQAATQKTEADSGLEAYDRHVETFGSIEGTASADVPGELPGDVGTGGARALDAHSVPVGDGRAGMPGEKPKSHRAIDEKLASVGGKDLGAIPMVSASAACDATVRDASQRRLPGPAGQPADFRETGFREDASACPRWEIKLVKQGRSVCFATCQMLVQELLRAKRDLRLERVDQEAAQVRGVDHRRPGLCPAEPRGDGGLVHVVVGTVRARQRAVSSNLPFSKWEQIFKDPMTTAAAIDRLIHHSVIIELNIPSYRLEAAKKKQAKKQPNQLAQNNNQTLFTRPI